MIKIAPSILSADFGKLNEEIATVDGHSDFLHVDVMDAHFVPNLTLGAPIVKCLKSKVPMECHLMISEPWKYLEDFAKAGAWMITVHVEAAKNAPGGVEAVLQQIKDLGVKASLSLNPPTDVSEIEPYLDLLDMVLVMTVNPGFGGQSFIGDCLSKVSRIRELKPDLDICMDGGIKPDTAKLSVEAGANCLVAGSYIFGSEDRKAAIESLRNF